MKWRLLAVLLLAVTLSGCGVTEDPLIIEGPVFTISVILETHRGHGALHIQNLAAQRFRLQGIVQSVSEANSSYRVTLAAPPGAYMVISGADWLPAVGDPIDEVVIIDDFIFPNDSMFFHARGYAIVGEE